VIVRSLQLTDFRNYSALQLALGPGVHALTGDNAQGKTNLVEALVVLSTMKSFRGVTNDAVVRKGATSAFLRADIVHEDGREFLVEIELKTAGRSVAQVNRKRITRTRDLLTVLRTTVFTPDDRDLVHGSATQRRTLLDDAVVSLDPARHDLINELERVLRQRNALLKESGYRPSPSTLDALDAWDEKLASVGDEVGHARAELVEHMLPFAQASYVALAGDGRSLSLAYEAPWRESGLAVALQSSREDDLRRGTTTVGPHRDDVVVSLDEFASRTQGSHGEQHSLGLALRMAVHHVVAQRWGTPPLVVLDDVLSALDNKRASAVFERLLAALPYRQVLVTSAHPLPPSPRITHWLEVNAGTISPCTQDER
jgi:DNA replication and repair protein RecF